MTATRSEEVQDAKGAGDTYGTIAVHVRAGAGDRVQAAARLARRFGARLVGIGAEAVDLSFATAPVGGLVMPDWATAAQDRATFDLREAEQTFRRHAEEGDVEWRALDVFADEAMIGAMRGAELAVMSPLAKSESYYRAADPAEVIMRSGRPVLILPAGVTEVRASTVLIAWKDTREARRAVADAMPFLLRAEAVIVLAVSPEKAVGLSSSQAAEVAAMLQRRGANARASTVAAAETLADQEIRRAAELHQADLVVLGAYGHNRLAEWAFGGVTDALIHAPWTPVLMSH